MSEFTCIEINIKLQAPVLTQGNGAMENGLDSAFLKDNEQPVLPGSLIRGNIRHCLHDFLLLLPEQDSNHQLLKKQLPLWFGQASNSQQKKNRAQLIFDHFWNLDQASLNSQQKNIRNRITINKELGKVERGSLQMVDSPFNTGQEINFSGSIHAHISSKEKPTLIYWLQKAMDYLPAIGSLKTIGFGKILSAQVNDITAEQEAETELIFPGDAQRFGISMNFDRPICIARPHPNDTNRFESYDRIPGAMIKSVLARFMDKQSKQDTAFNDWLVSHATPVQKQDNNLKRRRVLPLSLIKANGYFVDIAYQKEPALINGHLPFFQIDWKEDDYETAAKLCPHKTSNSPQLLVHTKIKAKQSGTQGKELAETGMLYSMQSIAPNDDVWCADIDLSQLTDTQRQNSIKQLKEILKKPLPGFGKTKAIASIEVQEAPFLSPTNLSPLKAEDKIIISLQTMAHILDNKTNNIASTNAGNDLYTLYKQYWQDISDGSMTLSHYYASQKLMGGNYLWQQFNSNQAYESQWLTNEGSVFILSINKGKEIAARKKLDLWQHSGIPPIEKAESKHWKKNPWLSQNGYGEITISQTLFTEQMAKENNHA